MLVVFRKLITYYLWEFVRSVTRKRTPLQEAEPPLRYVCASDDAFEFLKQHAWEGSRQYTSATV